MASVSFGEETGWPSVGLESDALHVDLLFKGPWGLRPPGAPPLEGSGDDEFMWNYAGGWQELFPSVNESCSYRGRRIPFHGEVATLPWQHEVLSDSDVRFATRCRETP